MNNINEYLLKTSNDYSDLNKREFISKIKNLTTGSGSDKYEIDIEKEFSNSYIIISIIITSKRFIYLNYDLLKFLFEDCNYSYTIAPTIECVFEIENKVKINFFIGYYKRTLKGKEIDL